MTHGYGDEPHEIEWDAERAEASGWEDLVNAAPAWFAEKHSTATWRVGDAVGFGYDDPPNPLFNRVIGLGVLGPATDEALAEAIKPWVGAGRTFVIHASDDNASAKLAPLLEARGLQRSRTWAKLVRGAVPAPVAPPSIRVEVVGREQAATFAEMTAGLAGLPDIAPWIEATAPWLHWILPVAGIVAVIGVAKWVQRRQVASS